MVGCLCILLGKGPGWGGKCRFGPVRSTVTATTLQLCPRSFTMATRHVLSSISPAKRPAALPYGGVSSASNCIHALRKNNIVTMPTHDVLLRHFCKMSLMVSTRGCTLLCTLGNIYKPWLDFLLHYTSLINQQLHWHQHSVDATLLWLPVQGQRKHFRIGQAIKNFCSLYSQISFSALH